MMSNIEKRKIKVGDHLLYIEYGIYHQNKELPVLVFLHDSWGCVEMWGNFPSKIQQITGLNTLVYDRQGHGQSSQFTIRERDTEYLHREAHEMIVLLDKLGIKNVIIYGHSDGATIALIAASIFLNRVKGLVLEGVHSFIESSGRASVKATREKAKNTNLLESLQTYHGYKTAELFRLWHETWLSSAFDHWSIVHLLHNIECKVLAFQGVDDEYGTVEQLNILKEKIRSEVTIFEIPNATHTPHKETEDESIGLIYAWFKNLNLD